MKVAIIHDWLDSYAGSERVCEQLLALYPQADLHALVDFLPDEQRGFLQGHQPRTSFIQRLPGARRHFRNYLGLMPLAIEQFDLSGYPLVISSSHCVAKGVLTGPDQLHISYVHSPMRYAWDLQHQYLRSSGLHRSLRGGMVRWLLHRLRLWDLRTANGVDCFVANSRFIARRIWKVYRRRATVIHPPVDVHGFVPGQGKDSFYLTASRMVPYKRLDVIIDAFGEMPDKRLLVIGDGPEMHRLRERARRNIEFLGHQPAARLKEYLQAARAFVFAAEEDFGIAPVEAQACGTPVIAYGRGGALETIRSGADGEEATGVFFDQQTAPSLIQAVQHFEASPDLFQPAACRANALRFAPEHFRDQMSRLVETVQQAAREGRLHEF